MASSLSVFASPFCFPGLEQSAHQLSRCLSSKKVFSRQNLRFAKVFSPVQKVQRSVTMASASSAPLDLTQRSDKSAQTNEAIGFVGVHHIGVICESLERSLDFYCGLLGLETCSLRPDKKLSYRGAWLWVGNQMIHVMELPNPDPVTGRPAHGGEDRHICVSIENPERLRTILEGAGIPYTMSKSGRPVIFARDPDGNALEFQPSYMHATPRDK